MDTKLRKILTESIRDMETGDLDIEGCLRRHAEQAPELRPHLELWRGLNTAPKAGPAFATQQRGQQRLMAALSDAETTARRRMTPFLTPGVAKAAAVIAGVALLAAGAASTSAAMGGPDVAGEVLTAVGVTHGNSPNGNANPNASERCENATQGRGNASDNAANAGDHPNDRSNEGGANGQPNANANPHASDRCLSADAPGSDAHGPNDNANPNAGEGAENADDQRGTANGARGRAPQDVPPPASAPKN